MRQICKGNHSAFTQLLERHQKRCYQIAWRCVFSKEDAQDVVQSVFLKIWQYPNKWDNNKNAKFSTWLYRVVLNAGTDFNRKHKKTVLESDSAKTLQQHIDKNTTNNCVYNDKNTQLILSLQKISLIQQQVVNLFYYEELSVKQTSEILKISKKSVEAHLSRARKQLSNLMEHDYEN